MMVTTLKVFALSLIHSPKHLLIARIARKRTQKSDQALFDDVSSGLVSKNPTSCGTKISIWGPTYVMKIIYFIDGVCIVFATEKQYACQCDSLFACCTWTTQLN